MKALPFFLSISFLCACGGGGGMPGDGDSSVDGGGGGEALVNGVPASEFYGQFVWEETGRSVGGAAAFPETGGYDAFKLDFFLMEDGSLHLFYGEGSGEVTPTGHSLNLDTSTYSRREGSWSVEGAELALGSWVRCGGLRFNDEDVLRCELMQRIVSEAAVGATAMVRIGSESSPFDSEWSDYQD